MTQDHRFLKLPPSVISDTLHHTRWRFFLVFSEEASMCLNLVWASVLHTEAYRHCLEAWMIDELLRHSPERAPSEPSPYISCQARRRPKTMWCISHRARFFPWTRGSEPKLQGGTFSPALIPSPAMNHQLLSQPRPHRNQSLVYFIPKPGLSNLAHFITPVIRSLRPHRTTCSVPSRFTPTVHPVQCTSVRLSSWASSDQHVSTLCPGNLFCLSPELAPAALWGGVMEELGFVGAGAGGWETSTQTQTRWRDRRMDE